MANQYQGSMITILAGIVISIIPGGQGIGYGLIVSGLFQAAAVAMAPDPTEATDERESPTYGYRQFKNPGKGDAVVPVTYADPDEDSGGIKTAPVWVQAFVSPRGVDDEETAKTRGLHGQGLSGLMCIGEGQIGRVDEWRLNDEPVFEKVGMDGARGAYKVGTGNGSKTVFYIPKRRIQLDTLQVYGDDSLYGWQDEIVTVRVGTGNGSKTMFSVELNDRFSPDADVKFYDFDPTGRRDPSPLLIDPDDPNEKYVPNAWLVSPTRMLVNTQNPYPNHRGLWVQYTQRKVVGCEFRKTSKNHVKITFDSAPGDGTEITAAFERKLMRGIKYEIRRGGRYQLPILGFGTIRNSRGVQQELVQNESVQITTKQEVDDVVLLFSSSESGFRHVGQHDGEAEISPTWAQFRVQMKRLTATNGNNKWNDWAVIPDPRGRIVRSQRTKRSDEFEVFGESEIAAIDWTMSIRHILEKHADKYPNDLDSQKRLKDFTRAQYEIKITRSSTVKADTNTEYLDNLYWTSYKEITEEFLSYAGFVMLGWHAFATEKVSGGAPNSTVVIGSGIIDCPAWVVRQGVGQWERAEEYQGNRVWAICDFLTNRDYGLGDHFTLDDIDHESALVVATRLDQNLQRSRTDKTIERDSRLCCTLDVRKPGMAHIREIATAGRFWVVQQGTTWRFIDNSAVNLLDVPLVYDDTELGRTERQSLVLAHDSVVTRPTDLYVTYLDKDADFQEKQILVTLEDTHTEPRRVQRVRAFGVTRRSEAVRWALFNFTMLRADGVSVGLAVSPHALQFACGDVFKLISDDVGITGYFRVFELSTDTDMFYVQVDARPYDPQVYGKDLSAYVVHELPILKPGYVTPTSSGESGSGGSDNTSNTSVSGGGAAGGATIPSMIVAARRVT